MKRSPPPAGYWRQRRRSVTSTFAPAVDWPTEAEIADLQRRLRILASMPATPQHHRPVIRRVGDLLALVPAQPDHTERSCNGLRLLPERRVAYVEGRLVRLTPRETALLLHLIAAPGVVRSRRWLLEHAWGYDAYEIAHCGNLVASVTRLVRAKIGPERIVTVRWRDDRRPGGYYYVPSGEA